MPIYQHQIPWLCTNAFNHFSSWWFTSFTYKVTTLLEIMELCVLVFACLLYCIKKRMFKSIYCYSIIYDTGSSLYSCIVSFIPLVANMPLYRFRPSPRHWSRRQYSTHCCHKKWANVKMNSSGIANEQGRNRYFWNRHGSRTERAQAHSHPGFPPNKPIFDPSASPHFWSLSFNLLPQFALS